MPIKLRISPTLKEKSSQDNPDQNWTHAERKTHPEQPRSELDPCTLWKKTPTQDDPDEGGVAEDAEQADDGVQAREDQRHRQAHHQLAVQEDHPLF